MLRTNEMNFKLSSSVHRCSLASNAAYRIFYAIFQTRFSELAATFFDQEAVRAEHTWPKEIEVAITMREERFGERTTCPCVCVRCFAITLPCIVSRRRIQNRGKLAVKYACQWPSERPKRSATRAPTRACPRFQRRVPNVRVQTGMEKSKRGGDCARTTFVGIVRRRIPIETVTVDFSGL